MSDRPAFAICGLGVVQGRDLGMSSRTLQVEAARLAIADAGLRRDQVDGAISALATAGSMPGGGGWVDAYSRVLGLPAKFFWSVSRVGSLIGMLSATRAIELGIADYVVVAAGDAAWSLARNKLAARPLRRGRAGGGNWTLGNEQLGYQAAVSAANYHAFLATRHMYEYGTTSEQFGAVAVAMRAWACRNPGALMYGKPMSLEDHQRSPLVIEPYHLLDCCLQSDAGVAFIVTSAERARDCPKPPVYLRGLGFGDQARALWWDKSNYTRLDVAPARDAAFRQAGITLADVDVAHLYDCFTAEVIFQLEDYGWCAKGDGGPFVASGAIGPGGSVPVNTGGGLLSGFDLYEYTGIAEIVWQLRGEAGARQIADAEIGIVTAHGSEMLPPGMCAVHGVAVLGR